MGLLSKFMNALIGEPPVSKTATQPDPRPAQQNVSKPTQQQMTQRKSTAQSRQTQQLTQPSQSSHLARSSYRAQTQTTARNTSVTTNRSRAQSHANSQPAQKLMPQPLLPADQIERTRNIIGKIEKHDLNDEQISAIAGAGHNTLVLAGAGTGKTTTIVGYIAWLLNTGTATPEEILVLSFTKASADEMSSRITQSTGKVIRACTFHSLGLEICRSSTIANRPIIDGHTSNNVVRNAFEYLLERNVPYRLLAFKLMSQQLLDKYSAAARLENFQLPTDDYAFNQYRQNLIDTIQTIIQHMRSNNIDTAGMQALNEHYGGKKNGRQREELQLIKTLFYAYLQNFATNNGIDFSGKIVYAINFVHNSSCRRPHQKIVIYSS